jgi:hypothetical protein
LTSALDGVSGQHHAPAAFYPRVKDPPDVGVRTVRIFGASTSGTARSFLYSQSLLLLSSILVPAAQPPNVPAVIMEVIST